MLSYKKKEILKLVEEYSLSHLSINKEYTPGVTPIPPSGKLLDSSEIMLMVEASLDGWLTSGRFNMQFEKNLADFIGIKHLLTVNSGSSANLVAFNTLTSPKLGNRAIRKGDEVITVAAGFPTTVNPIIQYGAIPVFIDIRLDTLNIDTSMLESAITNKTKAIMIAHTLGNPFDLETISRICKKYNLWLIEDCCDSLGSMYKGKHVGTFGDIGTLSFYPAHHITMGEGGAVFMNSRRLKKIAESFRDWGRDCYCPPGVDNTCNNRFCWTFKELGGSMPDGYDHKYIYSHIGYNLKITDMQAACGLAQLRKAQNFIHTRRNNYEYIFSRLEHLKDYLYLPSPTKHSKPSWFGFPITIKKESPIKRKELLAILDENKIGFRLLFSGNLTRQPYMSHVEYIIQDKLTNTDYVMENTFWIGLQPALTKKMLDYSTEIISKQFENINK